MRRRPSTAAEVPAVIWVPKRKRRNRRGKRRSRIPEAPSPTRHPIPRRSESSRPQNAMPSGSRFPQEPPRNPAVPQQKPQDSPRAMGLLPACPSPARNIDEAARHGDQFWHTQPAPTLSELLACCGAIEADRDSVRQGPSLPQGLTDTPDLGDADVLRALYRLLSRKHAVAKDCLFRFDCSPQFLLRCWHHSLNPRKLVEVRFSHVSRNTTLQRALKPCRLPAKGVDVFSTLDLMEDKTFLEKLKFGIEDGSLQYDVYNWGCPGTESGKVGLVLQ